MNSLNLRGADVKDAPGIAEVHVASWRSAYRGLIDQQVLDELSVSTRADGWRRILSEISAPHSSEMTPHRTLVADVDERIVGWASFGAGRDKGMTDQGEIAGLYVHPEFWSQKIGHALMVCAEQHLSDADFQSAYLWVLFGNTRAISFYERHGWAADGEEKVGNAGGAKCLREQRHVRALHSTKPIGDAEKS